MRSTDVAVIGGGQAGLAMSYQLTRLGIDHVVLERESRIVPAWRSKWDSFTLVTPNWTIQVPGAEYAGPDPDGFLPRDDVVAHFERYAASFGVPIETGVAVTSVAAQNGGYRLDTSDGPLDTSAVVVATGAFQRPRRPRLGTLPDGVLDLHSSEYRDPHLLPAGAVLVVGSGQSGAQIAEELLEAGRRVFLSVSRAKRLPRRYRGLDTFRWFELLGAFDIPVERLDSPAERFAANPHVSGKRGGHTLNLHRFARDGITLVGRLTEVDGSTIRLAPDLHANLRQADEFSAGALTEIDRMIAERGIDAPVADPTNTDEYAGDDGLRLPELAQVDLAREGISAVIWSAGYAFDFSWVRPASLDEFGYPITRRGVTDQPGLYFLGLHYLHTLRSGLLFGVGQDAAHIADHVASHLGETRRPA